MINIPNEVKDLLLTDGTRKNVRISFPDDYRADITNDSIVQNSVKFTESLCSQDELKFGLCEASVFECEVVGVENIKGMTIFCQLEVDCSSLGTEWCSDNAQEVDDVDYPYYAIPYGLFIVESCQKQADMSHRRIVAYSIQITDKMVQYQYNILRDKMEYEKTIPTYSFSPYMLAMGNYGRNKINDIEYTEVESEPSFASSEIVLYHSGTFPFGIRIELLVKPYYFETKGTKDVNKLVYAEMDRVPKNVIERIYAGYGRYIKSSNVTGVHYEHVTIVGSGVVPPDTPSYGKYYDQFTSQKYIYFQNWIGGSGIAFEGATIQIPYAIQTVQYHDFQPDVVTSKIEFRDPDSIHLYDCDVPIKNIITLEKAYDTDGTVLVNMDGVKSMLEGCVEMRGLFGKFDRYGSFVLESPNSISNLYPSETLFPSEDLYPQGMKGYSVPTTYSSAWYDDELSLPFGRVQTEYQTMAKNDKGEDIVQTVSAYFDIVSDYDEYPERYRLYDLSENYIIKNTVYTLAEIGAVLRSIAEKIANIRYMPCSISGIGMPWLEAGDTIALETTDGDLLKTIVLSRTLSGEQYLTDLIDSN